MAKYFISLLNFYIEEKLGRVIQISLNIEIKPTKKLSVEELDSFMRDFNAEYFYFWLKEFRKDLGDGFKNFELRHFDTHSRIKDDDYEYGFTPPNPADWKFPRDLWIELDQDLSKITENPYRVFAPEFIKN